MGAVLVIGLLLAAPPAAGAGPSSPSVGAVRGRVVDEATGRPLAGAKVWLPDTKTGTTTGRDGSFRIDGVATSRPYRRITAEVTAPNHGRWVG